MTYEPQYQPGDRLCVSCGEENVFCIVQLDDAMPPAFIYCKEGKISYPVPFGEDRKVFSGRAFAGGRHYLQVRMARQEEIAARKNLALNPWAAHKFDGQMNPMGDGLIPAGGLTVIPRRPCGLISDVWWKWMKQFSISGRIFHTTPGGRRESCIFLMAHRLL